MTNPLIVLPYVADFESHVFHIFAVRTEDRSVFQEYLLEHGIQTLIHYPIPPHKQEAMQDFDHLSLPVSELIHKQIVRSEEHTSELQSRPHLVCRLLLEKKKKKK